MAALRIINAPMGMVVGGVSDRYGLRESTAQLT